MIRKQNCWRMKRGAPDIVNFCPAIGNQNKDSIANVFVCLCVSKYCVSLSQILSNKVCKSTSLCSYCIRQAYILLKSADAAPVSLPREGRTPAAPARSRRAALLLALRGDVVVSAATVTRTCGAANPASGSTAATTRIRLGHLQTQVVLVDVEPLESLQSLLGIRHRLEPQERVARRAAPDDTQGLHVAVADLGLEVGDAQEARQCTDVDRALTVAVELATATSTTTVEPATNNKTHSF